MSSVHKVHRKLAGLNGNKVFFPYIWLKKFRSIDKMFDRTIKKL